MTGPWWRRAAREPLLHFAILGALLFAVYALVGGRGRGAGAVERDRPAIEVGSPAIDRLADTFRRAWKREPTRDELAEMTLDYVDDELLYREALVQHLDRDDPAVRRRLIEKMTLMARPQSPPREPSPDELRGWYADRRHHFHQPARFWFRQIFFDPRLRRGAINADAARALSALRHQPENGTGGQDASAPAAAGDPSPLPAEADGLTDLQLAHLYGNGFLQSLPALPIGRWDGPLSSTQGLHLVQLTRREPAREPPFEEVAAAVKADWVTAHSKGYLDAAASLLPRYRIAIAPEVRQRLQGSALLAPVLEASAR